MSLSFYLSAAHKSSGKTVISLGLCAAFKQQSLNVQTFKKGPDYIDPIWLSKASGNPCYNLDFYNMTDDEIIQLYQNQSSNSDIDIIEGNKGLFDGMSVTGGDANADLAKLLMTPVILVIDSTGITRGVAPLLSGYQVFDKEINIAGVILNKVASERHESKLIQAINYYTDIHVLGCIRRSKALIIDERHLGLMPANETSQSQIFIKKVANIITDQVDLNILLDFNCVKSNNKIINTYTNVNTIKEKIIIAIAKDAVFNFYYQDDLDKFESLGVSIKYFDTLKDNNLPICDGLFIGGGFPEMQLEALNANQSLLEDIKTKIEHNLPTYVECGGLMYLTNSITNNKETYSMIGIIDADSYMMSKPIGRGYVELEPTDEHCWSGVSKHIYAHEFHYSKLKNINSNTRYAFNVLRGVGVSNKFDGIMKYNLLASYTHLHNVASNEWVIQFVDFINKVKEQEL
ncbi:cobyrinate a,c-diamide synthase [Candidatus Vesicomyidisocius sp. SY067_SCS001]|uniref:cobyrinate a,c-diamide synthase n=1 Tax=Candidatus Vesicomyidisocius sp. SY067_SCS001 TaxID=2732590 RepID=UPI00168A34C3|nr:cobyrinate a,c-diamide synthase [Candidatus Vesicomyosocius sp. SY067_SCS001]